MTGSGQTVATDWLSQVRLWLALVSVAVLTLATVVVVAGQFLSVSDAPMADDDTSAGGSGIAAIADR